MQYPKQALWTDHELLSGTDKEALSIEHMEEGVMSFADREAEISTTAAGSLIASILI